MESLRSRPNTGFTLIELLVVLAIIMIISMVVLTSQSTFNKTLVLANTAYDIALTIRSAETFGLGSRAVGVTKNTGYGVYFSKTTPGSFFLFADTLPAASCSTPSCKPGDSIYAGGDDALVQTYTLGNGMTVSDFCADNGTWFCANSNGSTLSSLNIVFARPNPEPSIRANGASTAYTVACLTITSPQGGARFVSVGASGVITANATSCPLP